MLDDAEDQIKQEQEIDWQFKYEELETKYNGMITTYEVRTTEVINNQELPFIVKVDPYKRTARLELDQKKVKKLKRF